MKQKNYIIEELRSHLPFSITAVSFALILTSLFILLMPSTLWESSGCSSCGQEHNTILTIFDILHSQHILFSAAATSALFFKFERKIFKGLIISSIGAIVVCSISDILFPYITAKFFNTDISLHLCIIEHPMSIISFVIIGSIIGLCANPKSNTSHFNHSIHVFLSAISSLIYLAYLLGPDAHWLNNIGFIFIAMVGAVMLPCCLSDIVYPLMLSKKAKKNYTGSSCSH